MALEWSCGTRLHCRGRSSMYLLGMHLSSVWSTLNAAWQIQYTKISYMSACHFPARRWGSLVCSNYSNGQKNYWYGHLALKKINKCDTLRKEYGAVIETTVLTEVCWEDILSLVHASSFTTNEQATCGKASTRLTETFLVLIKNCYMHTQHQLHQTRKKNHKQ